MRSFSLATPLRSSALLYALGAGANTQSSSACNDQVTVTFIQEPLTVTVYPGNGSNGLCSATLPITDLSQLPIPSSLGIPSLPIPSLLDAVTTGLPGSGLSLSIPSQISVPSLALPTDVLTFDSLSLLTTLPSLGLSLPSISPILTVPSTILPTPVLPSVSISDLVSATTTNLPSIDLNQSLGSSLLSLSVSLPSVSLGLPTLVDPSLTLPSVSLPTPTLQPSSLLDVPSISVTLPAVSLTSGLTISITSSLIPSLGSLTLSPILPTLSLPGSLSGLSLSLAIPTISLSSVTALPNLPSTLLSVSLPGGLPTLSLPSAGTIGAVPSPGTLSLVYCPGDDGLKYLSTADRPFEIGCNRRRLGNPVLEDQEPDLQRCTDYCGDTPDCQSVSYRPANETCLLNSDIGTETPDSNSLSASTIDMSCPGVDNAQYMDYTGSFYQVLCDFSFHQSSNITTSPGRDYLACSSKCSRLLGCTGFSFTEGVCTLTTGLGEPSTGIIRNGTNTVILIAKRAVRLGPDGSPIVSLISLATNPRASISALLPSLTTLLPAVSGISSLTGTLLPPVTMETTLPSSLIVLPSSLGLSSIGSIDASITQILPTLTSLPTLSIPSIDTSGLSSLLPSIPTITVPSLTSISLGSASLPTSQGPAQTAVAYTCPEFDGRIVLENGLSYALNCSSIADGTPYASFPASSTFNDCFKQCDQSSTTGGAKYCTAFTYEGADRGAGPGTCYLFNDVSKSFLPAKGRKAIMAIRAVHYVAGPVENGVSSVLSSLLPGVTLLSTLPATTIIPSLTVSLPSAFITLSASASLPTTTCTNGGNILNGCIDATATIDAGAGASGGVILGPSGSPIVSAGVLVTLGVSLSADAGLGLSLSAGPSGLNLGVSATLSADLGVTLGGSGGLGLVGSRPTTSSTPILAIASTTSSPASLATATPRTTTIFTTSTITSCLTGAGGVLTCPLGGLFTTLPPTSGAVTSISTSISTQTSVSISVSVSISYITVTAAPATSVSIAAPASTLSTVTVASSRSSGASVSSPATTAFTSTSSSTCKGTVNSLGVCVLPALSGLRF